MAPRAIISYDDTPGDHDALMLGRILADAGAWLTLAYVRHCISDDGSQEELEEHQAETLLARGADRLADLDVDTQVVVSPSTPEGLRRLIEEQRADIVVFGSDYRTPAGHVDPGTSARRLLEGGPAAVAIAPANYRSKRNPPIRRIGVLDGDPAARRTANEIGDRLAALVVSVPAPRLDLLVVSSRPEAPEGRVMISARAENVIEESIAPVLVVPRGTLIRFGLAEPLAA